MGGCGSGTWYRWDTKPTTDNFWQLSTKTFKKNGLLQDNQTRSGSWQWSRGGEVRSSIAYELNTLEEHNNWLRVHYTNNRTQEKHDYKIRLTTTALHYGGKRWWFHCPISGCGKRVGVLYMGNVLGCRHCYNIAYPSQNQAADDRYTDKAFKLAEALGHHGNVIDGFYGKKPKGMHWRTYERKADELRKATELGLGAAFEKFGSEWY